MVSTPLPLSLRWHLATEQGLIWACCLGGVKLIIWSLSVSSYSWLSSWHKLLMSAADNFLVILSWLGQSLEALPAVSAFHETLFHYRLLWISEIFLARSKVQGIHSISLCWSDHTSVMVNPWNMCWGWKLDSVYNWVPCFDLHWDISDCLFHVPLSLGCLIFMITQAQMEWVFLPSYQKLIRQYQPQMC